MEGTIIQLLQEVTEDICNNFCKYQDTIDENGECDWLRNGGECPLDKIN